MRWLLLLAPACASGLALPRPFKTVTCAFAGERFDVDVQEAGAAAAAAAALPPLVLVPPVGVGIEDDISFFPG